MRATQRPCDVRPLSRYIWARLSRAVTWRQLSHIGNCQSRVPQYSRLSSRPTPTKVDSQVACGALQSILRSPAAPYSRFSGRLRRALCRASCRASCRALWAAPTGLDTEYRTCMTDLHAMEVWRAHEIQVPPKKRPISISIPVRGGERRRAFTLRLRRRDARGWVVPTL